MLRVWTATGQVWSATEFLDSYWTDVSLIRILVYETGSCWVHSFSARMLSGYHCGAIHCYRLTMVSAGILHWVVLQSTTSLTTMETGSASATETILNTHAKWVTFWFLLYVNSTKGAKNMGSWSLNPMLCRQSFCSL